VKGGAREAEFFTAANNKENIASEETVGEHIVLKEQKEQHGNRTLEQTLKPIDPCRTQV